MKIAKTDNVMRAMLIEKEAPEKAVQRLMEALDATTPQGWPDHRNRITAACSVLYQVDGKPVERRHQINESRTGSVPLTELLKSPAAREALMAELQKYPEMRAALVDPVAD